MGKLLSAAADPGAGLYEAFNSFSGDTLIHTRDAQDQAALKSITEIRIGDDVLAWNEQAALDVAQLEKAQERNKQTKQKPIPPALAHPSPAHLALPSITKKATDIISAINNKRWHYKHQFNI